MRTLLVIAALMVGCTSMKKGIVNQFCEVEKLEQYDLLKCNDGSELKLSKQEIGKDFIVDMINPCGMYEYNLIFEAGSGEFIYWSPNEKLIKMPKGGYSIGACNFLITKDGFKELK